MQNLKTQPALVIALLSDAVLLIGTLGFSFISGDQAGAFIAAIAAGGALLTAFVTRPIAPSLFVAAINALIAVVAAYGLSLNADTTAALTSLVLTAAALLGWTQISPIKTPVTEPTGQG